MQHTPSRDRQWHLYTVTDSKSPIQRMFLRTLVRQPDTSDMFSLRQTLDLDISQIRQNQSFTSYSLLRSLNAALEELELHMHNKAIKSDHSHMYLCILRVQYINDLMAMSRLIFNAHNFLYLATFLL